MNKIYESGWLNKLLLMMGIVGVVATFLMQDFSFLNTFNLSDQTEFIVRKVLRVFFNDLFMLVFIAAWFKDKRVTRFALLVQLIDGLILLPIYLLIKLHFEGTSEISTPLLSQFHRMIINPTLMILLIPAVYFQRISNKNEDR